jgi:tryptophan synthase alpha chain
MEALLLAIYSFFVWFIFIKKKWLPWNTKSQVTVVVIPIVAMTALILTLNVIAPSSSDARIEKVCHVTTGFVYAASTMGVTGTRSSVGSGARTLVERVRAHTSLPVAVGLGVSTGEQAAEVARYADGVIVGSAFISRILDAASPSAAAAAVGELAAELARGVRSGR